MVIFRYAVITDDWTRYRLTNALENSHFGYTIEGYKVTVEKANATIDDVAEVLEIFDRFPVEDHGFSMIYDCTNNAPH